MNMWLFKSSWALSARRSFVRCWLLWRTAPIALPSLLICRAGVCGPGDLGTLFKVDDENPLASVPSESARNQYPLEFGYYLQDLVARAQVPFFAGEYEKSIPYYEAIAKAVPETAIACSKLCVAYDAVGKPELALANCAKAMSLKGARVMDHTRFLKLSLNQRVLSESATVDIEASLKHLREHLASAAPRKLANEAEQRVKANLKQQLGDKLIAQGSGEQLEHAAESEDGSGEGAALPLETQVELFECKLASIIRDAQRVRACVSALEAQHAEPRVVLGFKWSEAAAEQSLQKLDAVLQEAAKLGMGPEAISALRENFAPMARPETQQVTALTTPIVAANAGEAVTPAGLGAAPQRETGRWLLWATGAVLAVLVALGVTLQMRRRTPRRTLTT